MKKLSFLAIIISTFAFVACESSTEKNTTTDSAAVTPTGETVEIKMDAKQWEFSPAKIEANQGDIVKLTIESSDVNHGILIDGYDINETLPPNETIEIEFLADKKGEFDFICSIPCGPGHSDMTGILTVK